MKKTKAVERAIAEYVAAADRIGRPHSCGSFGHVCLHRRHIEAMVRWIERATKENNNHE